jgi:hypothetical protein
MRSNKACIYVIELGESRNAKGAIQIIFDTFLIPTRDILFSKITLFKESFYFQTGLSKTIELH